MSKRKSIGNNYPLRLFIAFYVYSVSKNEVWTRLEYGSVIASLFTSWRVGLSWEYDVAKYVILNERNKTQEIDCDSCLQPLTNATFWLLKRIKQGYCLRTHGMLRQLYT